MWELDHRESWGPRNWCLQTVVLKKTLESPLDSKEIKPVNPKGNQSWIFTGRTDAEAPIRWPCNEKSWLIGKDLVAGKDWKQEEKGMTENEMVGWHHRLDGHESEQAPGVGDRQGSLACCSPWVTKSRTRLSDWTELKPISKPWYNQTTKYYSTIKEVEVLVHMLITWDRSQKTKIRKRSQTR